MIDQRAELFNSVDGDHFSIAFLSKSNLLSHVGDIRQQRLNKFIHVIENNIPYGLQFPIPIFCKVAAARLSVPAAVKILPGTMVQYKDFSSSYDGPSHVEIYACLNL